MSSTSKTPSDAPVIVIDPGHSRTINAVDKHTRLRVSDYENEPEMRDVFSVAQQVAKSLRAAGYRVVLTKPHLDDRRNLAQRAAVANKVHAALALSIHDQAGANGGIGFRAGNNTVYYQAVGDYRTNVDGKKIVFKNRKLAALSKSYAQRFATQRRKTQGVKIADRSNVGYNLGSRGLAPGNIWIVQLLSKVPWIYNEAGGNSAGRVGLNSADKATYARALVASVEACIPKPVPAISSLSPTQGSALGGSTISIYGRHFNGVRGVYFGSTRATRVVRRSPTLLRVQVPRHVPGSVPVRVRTAYGTSGARTFHYTVAP